MFRRVTTMRSGVFALAALVAAACGSSSSNNNQDAGVTGDAGLDSGVVKDSGAPLDATTGDAGALSCSGGDDAGGDAGAVSCEGKKIASIPLPACCVDNKGACGLNVDAISSVSGGLFKGCVETNQPSVPAGKAESTSCSALWTQVQAQAAAAADGGLGGGGDGGLSFVDGGAGKLGFTISAAGQTITFPGCCRLGSNGKGECGVLVDKILGQNIGFGCLPIDNFKSVFPNEATFSAVKAEAVCDPATGELPTGDAGAGDAGAGDAGI
jgi:hypothetical protein